MGSVKKATDEQVINAYERHKSVWKAARELGMCGQSVHERLQKLGVEMSQNVFTKDDEKYLSERYVPYRNAGQLQVLADEMGRTKTSICRKAGQLGLTDKNAPKTYFRVWRDIPAEVARPIWDDFKKSRFGVMEYCRRRHYGSQNFSDCMRRNFPDEYDSAIASKKPKSTQYARGRDFEYQVMKDMGRRGYLTLRSPASKSPVDVHCIKKGELVFVQCKTSGVMGVSEWNGFLDYCESVGALPIMAEKSGGKTKYMRITGKKDGSRRKQPMTEWTPPDYEKE